MLTKLPAREEKFDAKFVVLIVPYTNLQVTSQAINASELPPTEPTMTAVRDTFFHRTVSI